MSLDSVLAYDSMSEVRKKLAQVQGKHALEMAYQGYDGHQRPSQRAAHFRKKFAAHDLVRLGGPYSDEDVHAYLAGLCHAIWMEENVSLSWSLKDYDRKELRFLFERTVDMKGWTSRNSGHSGCWGLDHPGTAIPREPIADTWYQTYPLSFHLAGREPDKRDVVLSCVSWIMANFFHSYRLDNESFSDDVYLSSQWMKADWLVSLSDFFAQRVTGCHGPAKILAAMLRSLNIPAIEVHYQGHGICYVPTLDLCVHGDLMAEFTLLQDNSILLMDRAELERWIFQSNDYLSFNNYIDRTDLSHRNLGLRRRGFFLFVARRSNEKDGPDGVPSLPIGAGPGYYAGVQQRLPEYGVYSKQGSYYSRKVAIRGLDVQPACGLAVEVDKDVSGRVTVTLENRGLDLPGNQGNLYINIDDGNHSGGYYLPHIDQGFVKGGGRTEIVTNFQLGPDESGITRVSLNQLPQPCQTIEVMRHLGKPLELGSFDPSGPVILGPMIVDP